MSIQRDYWVPKGRIHSYSRIPQPGDIIAIDHDDLRHKPWLLADVRTHDDRVTLTLRTPGSLDLAASDKHHISVRKLPNPHIYILAGRYPLCSCCGDLMPCQQERAEDITEAAMRRAERYETPGICPACNQPVTARQASMTITTNLYVPLGPPVTFHQRKTCKQSLIDYEAAVATAEGRPAKLSCPGYVIRHITPGADLCTEPACPGTHLPHLRGYDQTCLHRACDTCRTATTTTEGEPA